MNLSELRVALLEIIKDAEASGLQLEEEGTLTLEVRKTGAPS